MKRDLIRLALRVLTLIALGILALAAFLIWQNPEGSGGYVTAAFAALQLVISKIGEAIRAGGDNSTDQGNEP